LSSVIPCRTTRVGFGQRRTISIGAFRGENASLRRALDFTLILKTADPSRENSSVSA
jgi:hypothetical protein